MKKIMYSLSCVAMVLMASLLVSCNGNEASAVKNVFGKNVAAIEQATVKISEAKEISELSEVNKALEDELASIEELCAEELKGLEEEKAGNADAYKSDEEAVKTALKAYDDAFVEKLLNMEGK